MKDLNNLHHRLQEEDYYMSDFEFRLHKSPYTLPTRTTHHSPDKPEYYRPETKALNNLLHRPMEEDLCKYATEYRHHSFSCIRSIRTIHH